MLVNVIQYINKHLGLVLTGLFVIRTGYLFINGLDLIGDEAYYWDWSGPIQYIGKTAFVISELNGKDIPRELTDIFTHFRKVGEAINPNDKKKVYTLFIGEGLKSWPAKAANAEQNESE